MTRQTMTRRTVTRVLLSAALLCAGWPAARAEPFVFVSLPDTQRYAEDLRPPHPMALDPQGTYRYFVDQTRWIVDHADEQRIRCVIHLGDVVQTASEPAQWERAKTAMNVIDDAGIPYGVCLGNHDLSRDRKHPYDTFLAYFGPKTFAEKPWFGGASPQGTSTYFTIDHEDVTFLFLQLSYATPRADVDWASELLDNNRDKIAIVSTHGYLWDSALAAGRYGERVEFPLMPGRAKLDRNEKLEGSMTSQEFYESFVQKHPNILMVQCGHSGLDWYRTDGTNGAGLPVVEALTDYQILPNGGQGYLRIYSIDPQAGTLTALTYSPTHDRYRTAFEHFVQLVALSFQMDEKLAKRDVDPTVLRRVFMNAMKKDSVPDRDVVGEHPDYMRHRDAYLKIFRETLMGPEPADAGLPEEWEAMWLKAFAADPAKPGDYEPNQRSPSWEVRIDLAKYAAKPEPAASAP